VHEVKALILESVNAWKVVSNDFMKGDFIPEACHGQVASDSASLPDRMALERDTQKRAD
jgi:hypothetical protein